RTAPAVLSGRLRHRPRRRARELDHEGRALPDFARDADAPAQLLDDLPRDREPEAQTAPLGGDEILEDGVEPLGRDAAARVVDADLDGLSLRFRRGDDESARRRGLD